VKWFVSCFVQASEWSGKVNSFVFPYMLAKLFVSYCAVCSRLLNPFDGLCSRVIYNSSGDLWIPCQAQCFLASAPPRDEFSRKRLFPRVRPCISPGPRLPAVYSRIDGFEYSEAVCEQ